MESLVAFAPSLADALFSIQSVQGDPSSTCFTFINTFSPASAGVLVREMAKLTDLPTEILESIFRQFLARELTSHEYMCEWWTENTAVGARAALYSLSRVSKALHEIALSLLYEQLDDCDAVSRMTLDPAKLGASAQCLAYTRYLGIAYESSEDQAGQSLFTRLQLWLPRCARIQHVYLYLDCSSSEASALLLYLAGLPGFSKLQSLLICIWGAKDGKHTVFRDVWRFESLLAFELHLENIEDSAVAVGFPERPLERLKYLDVCISTAHDLFACMALASPRSLQFLHIPERWGNASFIVPLAQVLGQSTWEQLESFVPPTFVTAAPASWSLTAAQLPALRSLHLRYHSQSVMKEEMPVIPAGLVNLTIFWLNLDQLEEILVLIAGGKWLAASTRRIILDISEVEIGAEPSNDDPVVNGRTYSKEGFIDLAQTALLAAEASNVVLKPDDLVAQISAFKFWRDAA